MLKPYRQIAIQESGDRLIPITLDTILLENPHPYLFLGADYQGKNPYSLRSRVIESLAEAQAELTKHQPGWKIKVFDAYRPIAVQQFMVDYTFQQILKRDNLIEANLSKVEREQVLTEVYGIWAIPSYDPATPPPHSTGAAIDLTLVNAENHPIDMGGEIDELSPRSQPDYYQEATDEQEQIFHQNRTLLNKIMESAGFLRHPGEWWHFSKGDQLWAWQYNQKHFNAKAIAEYGGV
ncbi:MAG: M15 family metallopeptidase [Microcystaceae cyanobacterium]